MCTRNNSFFIFTGKKETKKSKGKGNKANPSDKYTAGKRRYRTLDSMVLASATLLYLVMCMVAQAEAIRTSILTLVYALFLYRFTGQFL